MSGKSVNRTHPDYTIYIEKCRALQNKYKTLFVIEEERRKAEVPNWRTCLDALETVEKRRLEVQHNAELRELQQEYSYLFTEEES